MVITDYTTYEEVRAALGVSIEELPDSMLLLDLYSSGLLVELEGVDEDLPADYAVIQAIDEGTRTAAQARVHLATRQFAVYATAAQLLPALPLIAAKTITDGKASISRDSAAPFKLTITAVRERYGQTKQYLIDMLAVLNATTAADPVQLPLLSVITPSLNPVTG